MRDGVGEVDDGMGSVSRGTCAKTFHHTLGELETGGAALGLPVNAYEFHCPPDIPAG